MHGAMMINFLSLDVMHQSIKRELADAIEGVIRESAFVGGRFVAEFEKRFAVTHATRHCVGVGNGTDALEIALTALSLPAKSEVIVPALSFVASGEAVTAAGCRVVFCDIDLNTQTLDVADAARRITADTAAIMPVHLYGGPADMDAVLALAEKRGLKVIEDCAQAHGARYKGSPVGSMGTFGCFSFYPGKNLGAFGDAGCLLCNDDALARHSRMIANHGRTGKYDHEFEGRSSRLDGLQAAILAVKLSCLDAWNAQRKHIAAIYESGLSGISSLVLPQNVTGGEHVYHLYVIRVPQRDALVTFLAQKDIQTGIHYPIALNRLAAYRYLGQEQDCPIAHSVASSCLSLPMGPHMNDAMAEQVVQAVKEFFG